MKNYNLVDNACVSNNSACNNIVNYNQTDKSWCNCSNINKIDTNYLDVNICSNSCDQ